MLKDLVAPKSTELNAAKKVVCVSMSNMNGLDDATKAWLEANQFDATAGTLVLVPDNGGQNVGHAVFGMGDGEDPFVSGTLAKRLPHGLWFLEAKGDVDLRLLSIGFLLGGYRYSAFKADEPKHPTLLLDPSLDREDIMRQAQAVYLARDMVNTPTNEMGPDQIEQQAQVVAKAAKASVKIVRGDDLLRKGFPMVHAVGRASDIAPRLIDFSWGDKKAPKVTLVGKGVAFDTGGLDIKPASAMRNMKKDMGGSANVLALAQMIMSAKLNVRLRVLVPAVENAIARNAFRPGDILSSRKRLTVEIGHTDAEGRLILADALTLASEDKPDLIVDMATLTGAARVALGPELTPFYTNDDGFAAALERAAEEQRDPLWRMPLWEPYNKGLSSHVADMNNVTTDGFAGSITAALFLQRFVDKTVSWAHFDIFAWVPTAKPHAPVGGEAQAIRAIFAALKERYA